MGWKTLVGYGSMGLTCICFLLGWIEGETAAGFVGLFVSIGEIGKRHATAKVAAKLAAKGD